MCRSWSKIVVGVERDHRREATQVEALVHPAHTQARLPATSPDQRREHDDVSEVTSTASL